MNNDLAAKILDGARAYKIVADGESTRSLESSTLSSTMNRISHAERTGKVQSPEEYLAIVPRRRFPQ